MPTAGAQVLPPWVCQAAGVVAVVSFREIPTLCQGHHSPARLALLVPVLQVKKLKLREVIYPKSVSGTGIESRSVWFQSPFLSHCPAPHK